MSIYKLPIPKGEPTRQWNYAMYALDEARNYRASGDLASMRRRVRAARAHNRRSMAFRRVLT